MPELEMLIDGVGSDSLVATEETFGSVAAVVAIDSLEHAIEIGRVGGAAPMEAFTELQTVVLS